jgi:hypothetical protein
MLFASGTARMKSRLRPILIAVLVCFVLGTLGKWFFNGWCPVTIDTLER